MYLETLASLGEFIGGLAVLITIGYLAYQTRQTRKILEQATSHQVAAMLRANIDGWNHMFATIVADDKAIDAYRRMRSGERFEEADRERAELLAMMFFLNLENFIVQNKMTPFVDGVETVVQRVVRHHVGTILASPTLRDWWKRESICFSDQFREAVEGARAR